MKNVINYYYNISIEKIYQNEKGFYFDYKHSRYFLVLFEDELSSLQNIYNLHNEILKTKTYIHQIIINKDSQIITFVNGNPYILLKTVYYDYPISLNEITSFSNIILNSNEIFKQKKLWEDKNDHLEYQIKQLKNRYPLIKESFNYFLGLAETSIQLLNEIGNQKYYTTIAHKRINFNDSALELYNPLNLIIDTKVRDIAEYLKSKFFNDNTIEQEIKEIFKNYNFTVTEYYLFLARMFYPTYYFDLYEEIIKGKKKEVEIKKIINKAQDYELVLKNLYNNLKKIIPISSIEWLETIEY